MRLILLIFLTILLSCNKDISRSKIDRINIDDNLSFNDFKRLIEEKSLKKDEKTTYRKTTKTIKCFI